MQVQISPADYIAAVRLKMKPSRAFTVVGLGIVVLVLLALFVVSVSNDDGKGTFSMLLLSFGSTYLAVWYWLVLPWRIKRLYAQQQSLHEPFTLEVEASGIRFKSQLGEGLLPWQHIYRWKESSMLYLVFQSDALMHIIPKSSFVARDEAKEFGTMLMQRVGPANKALKHNAPKDGARGS